MVDDYTERSRYSSVRMMFSTFGAILAGLIPTMTDAPIFSIAHYGIVGDLNQVIPMMIKAVKERN